jgi:phage tail sheath protein FI
VVSQEFSITVERIENGRAAESETFERLSLASEHPRYAPTQVGRWDTATGRPSESGGSNLIRLEDNADSETRLLPLVTGVPRRLDGGNDDVAGVSDDTYAGTPSDDPKNRTGIQALENEPTLSIVAVPGQVSVPVQKALVAHCERMRYRFCVLDTPIGASLERARTHRQNFDNTRTAILYPALEIADRFGAPGERRVIPPSGHVLGVYARTDLTRGVHKAPANEVIEGILSFDNKLDKAAQDILNPINLNCLRDFRTENRGLRVFGARVATSDPEWRYVNVRRLLLFIEQSSTRACNGRSSR